MKALLINGSPRERGCTYTALSELARTLEAEGIETELIQAGAHTTHGCIRPCVAAWPATAAPSSANACLTTW